MDMNFNFTAGLEPDNAALPEPDLNLPTSEEIQLDLPEDQGLMLLDEGMSEDFKPQIPNDAAFDSRLVYEIALGFEPPEKIYPRYDITPSQWELLAIRPIFKRAVMQCQQEMDEEGIPFRLKAKIQAEAYLKDVHYLIKNGMTPPTTKLAAIQWVAKMGDLEPKKAEEQQGTTFNLQINL